MARMCGVMARFLCERSEEVDRIFEGVLVFFAPLWSAEGTANIGIPYGPTHPRYRGRWPAGPRPPGRQLARQASEQLHPAARQNRLERALRHRATRSGVRPTRSR